MVPEENPLFLEHENLAVQHPCIAWKLQKQGHSLRAISEMKSDRNEHFNFARLLAKFPIIQTTMGMHDIKEWRRPRTQHGRGKLKAQQRAHFRTLDRSQANDPGLVRAK